MKFLKLVADGKDVRFAEGEHSGFRVATCKVSLKIKESEDYAYLFANSPELLKACKLLLATVDDFMPNIGHCVLQDYGRLNDGLIKGRAVISAITGKE